MPAQGDLEEVMTHPTPNRWRTVDIVVASVLAVAFGVIFWAWNTLWEGPANAIPLPGRGVIYGVWLVPAVLGPLVIRKPGAGVYTELVAALVSALLGTPWGLIVILYGLFQGVAGEFAFALTRYRNWRLPVAVAGGALAGAAAALLDIVNYYATWSADWKWAYTGLLIVSSAVIAGGGAWALARSLAQTGVLDRFPSGRERVAV
jgi:energy-coupling factor transport system substrate-specific component